MSPFSSKYAHLALQSHSGVGGSVMRISRAIRAAVGVAVAAGPAPPPPHSDAGNGDPFANHALGLHKEKEEEKNIKKSIY